VWEHPRVERADAVIVGGGVIGLSCARELLGLGVGDVMVLEALQAVGGGSSARANGGFRAQFTTAPNIAFSSWSIGELEALQAATGSLEMHQTGYLLMAGTAIGERALHTACELQRSLGVATEWLAPDAAIEKAPFVRRAGLRAATFHARDGFLDPAGVVSALLADARARGADVRTGSSVRAIERRGAALVVDHERGQVRADVVINAAGADARQVAALVGVIVPVDPIRRNLAMFLDPAPVTELSPMCVDLDTGVLARREAAGGWVVAYSDPDDEPSRETTVDPRFLEELAGRVPNRFPFLADLPVDPARC
jgi:sarcosine oxidase subunit beta